MIAEIFHSVLLPETSRALHKKIGSVLGLCNEKVNKKITYDASLEKFRIYFMTEFKGGENVVEFTKNPKANIVGDFEKMYKQVELIEEENNHLSR